MVAIDSTILMTFIHPSIRPCILSAECTTVYDPNQDFKVTTLFVIAQDLSPSIHISEIAAKAHQRANCPANFCVQRHKPANESIYCLRASN